MRKALIVEDAAYLSDLSRFRGYNAIYQEFFSHDPPARSTIGCQLLGIQVEFDRVAVLPG